MRLINVDSFELEEHGDDMEYAILSHTWGEKEVTFAGFSDHVKWIKRTLRHRKSIRGDKIAMACEMARSDGIKFVWVDTCCIDKSSSAELSEAINSMYRWYAKSKICYAHLADISTDDLRERLMMSRWFTRGWTLQELVAPSNVKFFSKDWRGFAWVENVANLIAEGTGIPRDVLGGRKLLDSYSIARRMSWSAKRQTTRLEDRAYSLMGIFNVNMPLLYGEGESAFRRLQQEIIRISVDQSIFAWGNYVEFDIFAQERSHLYTPGYVLARSPTDYEHGHRIDAMPDIPNNTQYSFSNQGLHIQLPILHLEGKWEVVAVLACKDRDGDKCYLGQVLGRPFGSHTYKRYVFDIGGQIAAGVLIDPRVISRAEPQQLTILNQGRNFRGTYSRYLEKGRPWNFRVQLADPELLAYQVQQAMAGDIEYDIGEDPEPQENPGCWRWQIDLSSLGGSLVLQEQPDYFLLVLKRRDDDEGKMARLVTWINEPFYLDLRSVQMEVMLDNVVPHRSASQLVADLGKCYARLVDAPKEPPPILRLADQDVRVQAEACRRDILDQVMIAIDCSVIRQTPREREESRTRGHKAVELR